MGQGNGRESTTPWGGRRVAALVAFAMLALIAAVLAGGCGGSSSSSSGGGGGSGSGAKFGGSAYPGVDVANTRFIGGPIERATAPSLKPAWKLPLSAESSYGAFSSTPVISEGVVYAQDLESNVMAVDLESGETLWTKEYNEPDQGPNGVTVAAGMVFGATPTEAFALDAETGEQVWSTKLTRKAKESIDMAPGYHGGLVYVSTVPTDVTSQYFGGISGTLYALDAETGKKAWSFDTAPTSTWSKAHTDINSGGGLWYAPSFDESGSMYFGTGNPVPWPGNAEFPWGKSRPGPNLSTDSMVKLDAETGKLRWYYQQTPHDLYDWDFQDPPILANAGGRELAIGAGKGGVVVALDTKTGKPVWKTPVGTHNGHDSDNLLALHGEYSKLKTGATVYPGTLGGVIAPMAASQTTVFVPVVNHSLTIESGAEIGESAEMTGEMVAIDIATGKVLWHENYPAAAFGAPTAINDMVFFATFDGTVHGLDAETGGEVWTASLPAGANSGLTANGDTLIVPAGIPTAQGQTPALVAYRIAGE
jgi:outer membrane protein assembly factor BamB